MNRKEVHIACTFKCLVETEGISQDDRHVDCRLYTCVVISRKRRKIETLLLQTTNRKWVQVTYGL